MKRRPYLAALLFLLTAASAAQNRHASESNPPVAYIPSLAFRVVTPQGDAAVPYAASADWSQPHPEVTRAVILVHGKGRDVRDNYISLLQAAATAEAAAHTILLAPQFLIEEDAEAHVLPAMILRWRHDAWQGGEPAISPYPVSAYEVLDAMVRHLADRKLFPNLQIVVIAGHSAGGQAIQRYAVVGKASSIAAPVSIDVRYVVANPSSYLYFSDDRPTSKEAPFTFAPRHSVLCGEFSNWKYGPHDPPPYVKAIAAGGWQPLEDAYAQRDVIYLLGTDDTDPHHKELDVTCSGEAEGPSRFLRGRAYYAYLHSRHPAAWNQRLWFVPGVAHSEPKMFESACGVAALFDSGTCQNREP
jgi:pimeloyl-ACP methyl ester carboxylesterase